MKEKILTITSLLVLCSLPAFSGLGEKTPAEGEAHPRRVLPQGTGVARYQNAEYRRASAIRPLKEIANLPDSFADDLGILVNYASAQAKTPPDLSTEGLLVKNYQGVNHTHHGLMQNGVGEVPSKPEPGVYFTEHCFSKDGKLVKAVAHQKDGTRFVERTFLYQGDLPSAMLTFSPTGLSFGNYAIYHKGRLALVARIDPAGNVMSCECVFYMEDREDYSVRYVAPRTSRPFRLSDLRLESVHLNGPSTLHFDQAGDLADVWHQYPQKQPE